MRRCRTGSERRRAGLSAKIDKGRQTSIIKDLQMLPTGLFGSEWANHGWTNGAEPQAKFLRPRVSLLCTDWSAESRRAVEKGEGGCGCGSAREWETRTKLERARITRVWRGFRVRTEGNERGLLSPVLHNDRWLRRSEPDAPSFDASPKMTAELKLGSNPQFRSAAGFGDTRMLSRVILKVDRKFTFKSSPISIYASIQFFVQVKFFLMRRSEPELKVSRAQRRSNHGQRYG